MTLCSISLKSFLAHPLAIPEGAVVTDLSISVCSKSVFCLSFNKINVCFIVPNSVTSVPTLEIILSDRLADVSGSQ